MNYSRVVIIYNPNSTGGAKANALKLQHVLNRKLPKLQVMLSPSQYAGHGTELAYEAATKYDSPLIISASGDGGYNDVLNGALRAQAEGATPICAVLPSGNANDHAHANHDKPLAKLIIEGSVRQLDVLKVIMRHDGSDQVRYAHSYVGLGLTSQFLELADSERDKNSPITLRESFTLFRAFGKLRPVRIHRGGRDIEVDSLVCSTAPLMAKVFTLSRQAKPDDGRFEVMTLPHDQKHRLVWQMFKGVVSEIGARSRVNDYKFKLLQKAPIQFDGEVVAIDADTDIEVVMCPGLLRTVA